VTGNGFREHGDSVGILIATVAVQRGEGTEHKRSTVGRLHCVPPALS
jgi:hypothetical protein